MDEKEGWLLRSTYKDLEPSAFTYAETVGSMETAREYRWISTNPLFHRTENQSILSVQADRIVNPKNKENITINK